MAFDEINASEFEEAESANTEEVAELPEEPEDSGEKEPEAAEPESEEVEEQDSETNAAFAELRRRAEAAEREAAELKKQMEDEAAEREAMDDAIAEITGEDEDAIYKAIADAEGISIDEVKEQIEAEVERQNLIRENEELKKQIEAIQQEAAEAEADKAIADDLAEIRKVDPAIKSIDDLPEGFEEYRLAELPGGKQMTATQAYFAAKQMAEGTKITPPPEIGKVDEAPVQKDYFTEAEVYAMTSEEKTANADKIFESFKYWKK